MEKLFDRVHIWNMWVSSQPQLNVKLIPQLEKLRLSSRGSFGCP